MRVTKSQIVQGVADYIKEEILPKMDDGKAMQIIVSIGINAVAANERLIDSVFENDMVKAFRETICGWLESYGERHYRFEFIRADGQAAE